MEWTLESGLLGEFDYHGDTIELGDIPKPTIMKDLIDLLKILGCGIASFIVLIIGLTFLGSCMGCNSCINCLDDCSVCDSCQCGSACYECGKECRSGCGCTKDCGSCGDNDDEEETSTSSSSGCGSVKSKQEVYHIVYENGETKDLIYETTKQGCSVIKEGFTNFDSISRNPEFFTEEGYYKDAKFKKMVIAPSGEILKSLKPGATYYSKSKELYVGEERTINIQFKDGSIYPITATVGSSIVGMPTIPTLEGYVFVGGYCGNKQVISSKQQLIDPTFHLYNYGSTADVLNVELKYEAANYKAKVYINTKSYVIEAKHGTLLKDVIFKANEYVYHFLENNQMFVGWSFTNKESELIADSTIATQQVTKDIDLYAIIKSKQTILLDYNNGKTQSFDLVAGQLTNLPTTGFTNTGYKFVGWCKNKDLSDTPITQITYDGKSSLTLYAKWEPEQYTIEYLSSITDGLLTRDTYTYGDDENIKLANYEDIWTRDGYQFKGWSTSKSEKDIITELPANLYGNIKIYAIYSSKKFTVQLDEGYGSLTISSMEIEYGKTFILPVPTIDDTTKEFIGYYYNDIEVTNKKGTSLISFTETALKTSYINLSNITLTAKFDVKKFTIEFYSDSKLVSSQEVQYNEFVTAPQDPTLDGYNFIDWRKRDSNVAYDFANSPVTETFKLYAHFEPKTYTVNLEIKASDAAIATLTTTSYSVKYGKSFTLPVPTTDVAYNFMGYKLSNLKVADSNGNSSFVFDTHNLNRSISEIEAGLTFTAEFEMKTYEVQYFYNSSLVTTKTINYGNPASNIMCPNIPTGYEFKGWTINRETKELYDFTNSSVINNLKLYAVVEPMQFTITLQITPLFGLLSQTSITVEYDSSFTLPVPTLNEGYTFVGYKYQNIAITDEKGASLKPFTTALFGNKTIEELQASLTLTADCKEIVYMVYYHYNNDVFNQREVSYGGTALEISGPTSLEVGYRFLGWSAQENSKELYDFTNILTTDLHLYAVLSNEYKVTLYDSDKTTVLATITVKYGSTNWSISYDPALSSSEWIGWYSMDDDSKVADKSGTPVVAYTTFNFTEDINLYIKK